MPSWDTTFVNWLFATFPAHFQQLPSGQLVLVLPNQNAVKLPHHYQDGLFLLLVDPNPLGKLCGLFLLKSDRLDFKQQISYSKLS